MLFELDVRPISVRFVFACDENACEGGGIVGKDVASVEQLLMKELEKREE